MKYYFVKILYTNEDSEQICFNDYTEAVKLSEEMAKNTEVKTIKVIENIYWSYEKIK